MVANTCPHHLVLASPVQSISNTNTDQSPVQSISNTDTEQNRLVNTCTCKAGTATAAMTVG